MSKIILCDCDTVLNNLLDVWIEWLNRKYDLSVQIKDITNWDIRYAFPTLTTEEIFQPLYTDVFWCNVTANKYAYNTLKAMKDAGYRVYIVTNSNYQTWKSKMQNHLLRDFSKIITPTDIIVTSHKELLKCDYIIDDYENNLTNSDGIRILVSMPYNMNCEESKYDIRVSNIQEAWNRIKELDSLEG